VLGDEVAWHAFAALGRRVEAFGDEGRDALEAIRATFAPIEAQAWDEADELWASSAGADAWSDAADRWDAAVRAGLASLSA
jgi:hypothetical protein